MQFSGDYRSGSLTGGHSLLNLIGNRQKIA